MRKTVPVVVIGGAALLIASQFFSINVGLRDPSIPLKDQVESKLDDAADAVKQGAKELTDQIANNEPASKANAPENAYVGLSLADVLIDGDKYLLLTATPESSASANGPTDRKEVAKYEVIRLAKELPGDSTGIKVRVWRTANATAQAESELLAALHAADVSDDKIDFRTKLVEP